MINQLPEGKSIGWMQAPPQWIFTHTVRFIGVVRVVIQDGEGFILIKKGKPLVYYFKHGRIELHGHGALDYFNSHPTIEFNLCKYTPEEFSQALKICNVEDPPPGTADKRKPARAKPVKTEVPVQTAAEAEAPRPEQPLPDFMERPEIPKPVFAAAPAAEIPPEKLISPQPVILEELDIKIIGQIKKLNGIVAISVFNDDRNILLMGDVEIEPLLKIARTMLATTKKITPHLDWGSLVHMTLQIPEGNVIIAPYRENHLCILTTRTINIGHIRRILRDLQQERSQ
jgi:hypothetical protein